MNDLEFIKLVRNRFEYIMDHAGNVPMSYRGSYLEGAIDHELCILDTYISERKGELLRAHEQITKEADTNAGNS